LYSAHDIPSCEVKAKDVALHGMKEYAF